MDLSHLNGWWSDGGHHAAAQSLVCADLRPVESRTPGGPILLYKAWKDVLGAYPDYPAQQIGDCVGQGHAHANDLLQCIEIALGEPSEYRETCSEFVYAASRQVAGILGPFDGSYGSAACRAMTQLGIVSREMAGGSYDGQRAKEWGRRGVPNELAREAKQFQLGAVALIDSWDKLIAALWNGLPVTTCGSDGFSMERDRQGFCKPRGRWDHCMFIAGVRFDRPGACFVQSWGADTPQGPLDLEQPSFSFWVDRAVVERRLALKDSWALMKSPNFVERPIPQDWTQA